MTMQTRFPITVRRGSVAVKIYHQASANVFTLMYYQDGERKRPSFADLQTAREQAGAIADRLARGDVGSLVLKDAARLQYARAQECLAPLGVPLDIAASEYAQALAILNSNGSLVEAARHFASTHAGAILPRRTEDLVADLIEARKRDGSSKRHIDDRHPG